MFCHPCGGRATVQVRPALLVVMISKPALRPTNMQWLASAHEVWRIATRPIDCGAPASHGPPHESDVTAVKESESNPPSSTSRQLPLESQVRYQGSPPTVGAGCVYRFVDVPWM